MCFMGQSPFYDDIAEYYDLIYADWEGSMRRHGAAISEMLRVPGSSGLRIRPASGGIQTPYSSRPSRRGSLRVHSIYNMLPYINLDGYDEV